VLENSEVSLGTRLASVLLQGVKEVIMRRRKRSNHYFPSFLFLLALVVSAAGPSFSGKEKPWEEPKMASGVGKVPLAEAPSVDQTCAHLTAKHRETLEKITRSVEFCDESLFLSACPDLNENAAACVRLGCGQDCSFNYSECSGTTFRSALYGTEEESGYTEKCLKRLATN
jgi:hypothetical protein